MPTLQCKDIALMLCLFKVFIVNDCLYIEDYLARYIVFDADGMTMFFFRSVIDFVCRMFYGPGGAYALFAGKDASRALAKMSFEQQDLNGDISDLTPMELGSLNDWEYKFTSKYVKVGTVRRAAPAEEGYASISPAIQEEVTAPVPVLEPELDPEPKPIHDDAP